MGIVFFVVLLGISAAVGFWLEKAENQRQEERGQ